MSAVPTRIEPPPVGLNFNPMAPQPGTDPAFPLQEGNRVLESLARRQSFPSLLAYSALHEQIHHSGGTAEGNTDLLQTERFILDEVLQLLCDHAQSITQADGVIVALSDGSALVCRAGSGSMAVERGVHLVPDSELLQDGVQSGRILSADDCAIDIRAELDLSRMLGARSTVIVPLRGTVAVVGVLQAFAQKPFAFSQDDIRSLDFFGELLLSALKPKDQHRRLNWLADVADQILAPTPRLAETFNEPRTAENEEIRALVAESEPPQPADAGLEAVPSAEPVSLETPAVPFQTSFSESSTRDLNWPRPVAATFTFLTKPRPGLSGVLALVTVAALFSAGVWWGMQNHVGISQKSASLPGPQSTNTRPAVPAASSGQDHSLDATKVDSGTAPPVSPSSDQLAALPKITGLRHWSSSVGSTVVIDMEDPVPYEVHRLTSPERIYFDLHDTRLAPGLDGKSIDVSDSSLTRMRVAQPVAGVTRIVLDTRNGSNFSVSMESNPYRLIVELRDSAQAQLFTPAKPPVSSERPAPASLLAQNSKRGDDRLKGSFGHFHIVLDAGHGGWDLGTVGRDGLLEKDLVLDVTERLGKLLKIRLGADVTFTRTNDDYLPLDQRAEIANQAQADLFVSVHANYSKVESARGVETYYTDFFSAPGSREIGSREIEKRENGTANRPTPVALSPSELHDKIEESRQLALTVQHSLYGTLASRNPGIRDRGVKDSAFVVLTGTTMPAILTEISFVSSPADERNLQSEAYRQQIAEALYQGIARYEAAAHHHVRMAQIRPASAAR